MTPDEALEAIQTHRQGGDKLTDLKPWFIAAQDALNTGEAGRAIRILGAAAEEFPMAPAAWVGTIQTAAVGLLSTGTIYPGDQRAFEFQVLLDLIAIGVFPAGIPTEQFTALRAQARPVEVVPSPRSVALREQPRIVVLTALWKRPELTRVVLNHYAALQVALAPKLDLQLVAVGSEGGVSRGPAEEAGWRYLEWPNKPVGAKNNAGMAFCAALDPDAVVVVGSDDFLDAAAFHFYTEALRDGYDLAGFTTAHFLDLHEGIAFAWQGYNTVLRQGDTLGHGRLYSRNLLERCRWALWGPGLNRTLDASARRTITHHHPQYRERAVAAEEVGVHVLVTRSSNMHTTDALRTENDPAMNVDAVLEHLPPKSASSLRALLL